MLTAFFNGNAQVDAAVHAAIRTMHRHGATAAPVDLGSQYATLWDDVLGPVGTMEFAAPESST